MYRIPVQYKCIRQCVPSVGDIHYVLSISSRDQMKWKSLLCLIISTSVFEFSGRFTLIMGQYVCDTV